jgi:hypothetical protein
MKYKKIFVFFLLFLTIGQAPAQKPGIAHPTPLSGYKSVTIRLPSLKNSGEAFNRSSSFFSSFTVIDDRLDTTRVGVHMERPGAVGPRTRQVVFPKPATMEISDFLNARFSNPKATLTALVVIRILWLSDAIHDHDEIMKGPYNVLDRTKVRMKMEIYAVKDSIYIPLLRYDSMLLSRRDSYKDYSRELAAMLEDLADSSSLQARKKWAEGRRLRLADIYQFNASRSDAAISQNIVPSMGVYKDFAEFKNNTPSITDYEIKKDKDEIFLYLKEAGGHSFYTRNAWGYCDGRNVFIMKEGLLVPAWKEGRAWYLQEKISFETNDPPAIIPGPGPAGSYGGGGMLSTLSGTSKYTVSHIYTIDMDTGTLY